MLVLGGLVIVYIALEKAAAARASVGCCTASRSAGAPARTFPYDPET